MREGHYLILKWDVKIDLATWPSLALLPSLPPSSDIATSQCVTVSLSLSLWVSHTHSSFRLFIFFYQTKRVFEFVCVTVGITCNLMQDSVYSAGSLMTRACKAAAGGMGNCFACTRVNHKRFNIKKTLGCNVRQRKKKKRQKTFPPFLFCNGKKLFKEVTHI